MAKLVREEFLAQRAGALLTTLVQLQPRQTSPSEARELASMACTLAICLWEELSRIGAVEAEPTDQTEADEKQPGREL